MLLSVNAHGLRHRREMANMTPYQLAKMAKLSINSIYRLESGGTKKTNLFRAQEIAHILGCKVEDICEIPATKTAG